MILTDLERDPEISCDVCIVGSGAAGITLAMELAKTSLNVLVLAGGGWTESSKDRDLYAGSVEPPGSHEPLEENRRRMMGGTTTVWGGRCVPFDPIDFRQRDWIPHSGWPFDSEEVEPYLLGAASYCDIGDPVFDARVAFPSSQREILPGFDSTDVASWPMERWSPPTNFAKTYRKTLEQSPNIRVLLDTHATHIHLSQSGTQVEKISCADENNRNFSVRARHFVLACGGLENARLLMASRDVATNGIGNDSGNVGRFYMAHIFGTFSTVRIHRPDSLVYAFERDQSEVFCRRRWWITPEAQEKERIGNCIFFFFRPTDHNLHRDAIFSVIFLVKTLKAIRHLGPEQRHAFWQKNRRAVTQHLHTVQGNLHKLPPEVAQLLWNRYFRRRRLPFVLPKPTDGIYYLFYQGEHCPSSESRLELSIETDGLGMPRLRLKPAFSDLDLHTALRAHEMMRKRFQESGTGVMDYDPGKLRAQLQDCLRNFNSSAHHLGTTRMSANPAQGVVDKQCTVHGVSNLHVAGSSVFPTGGHANPTLLIVALAIRQAKYLAKHLKD